MHKHITKKNAAKNARRSTVADLQQELARMQERVDALEKRIEQEDQFRVIRDLLQRPQPVAVPYPFWYWQYPQPFFPSVLGPVTVDSAGATTTGVEITFGASEVTS